MVLDQQGKSIWRSDSMLAWSEADSLIDQLTSLQGGDSKFQQLNAHDSSSVFVAMLGTIWEDNDTELGFTVAVIEDAVGFTKASNKFRNTLWLLLLTIGVSLLIAQLVLLRWGLKPLASVVNELKAIEQGCKNELTAQYPLELEQLTSNINRLLHSEQQQRQKYSHRMADLAHSLKTPLAILNNAPKERNNLSWQQLEQQVSRMNNIVEYHLKRAVIGSQHASIKRIPLLELATNIKSALDKVYVEKGVQCRLAIADDLTLRADESDITEVLANLMDNAYKYGVSKVKVSANVVEQHVVLRVEDDGAGLTSDTFAQALSRGTRLDTQQAGQGIGLAMVQELVTQYQGDIRCCDSELLGAMIEVSFPEKRR